MNDTAKRVMLWIAGALFLIMLADKLPKFVIWLVALILVGVVIMHSDTYLKFANDLQTTKKG